MTTPKAIWIWGIVLIASSCNWNKKKPTGTGKVLATVYDRQLYESDLATHIPGSMASQDSATYANTYIDKWIKDQVILAEAEKSVAADINIDRLVDDYRSSLLMYNYEKRFVEDKLDTVITEEAFKIFYEQEKEQFTLLHPIVKYEMYKIPSKTKRIDKFFINWRNDRSSKVKAFVDDHAESYVIDTLKYTELPELMQALPEKFKAKEFKKKQKVQHYDDGFEYFVKVYEYHDSGEVPPLSYIRETLRKRILHDRKTTLFQGFKQKLYELALEANKIKRYKE